MESVPVVMSCRDTDTDVAEQVLFGIGDKNVQAVAGEGVVMSPAVGEKATSPAGLKFGIGALSAGWGASW